MLNSFFKTQILSSLLSLLHSIIPIIIISKHESISVELNFQNNFYIETAAAQLCSVKKQFLKISQNLQDTCIGVCLQLSKKRFVRKCFWVNCTGYSTAILQNAYEGLTV